MSESAPRVKSGMSIQQKLPLLVSALLLVVIIAYSWASYEAVKSASLDVARQRLLSLTDQLAQLFDQSVKTGEKSAHALASDAAVHDFVTSRMNLACALARLAIQSMSLWPGPRSRLSAIALSAFS